MSQFAPLGRFLILAFIFPGAILSFALAMLFPQVPKMVPSEGGLAVIRLILVVAFINGHLAYAFEGCVLDPVWNRLYPGFRLKERKTIAANRSRIIAQAEIDAQGHSHYDQTLGEFVLVTNTAFGLFIMSGLRLLLDLLQWRLGAVTGIAAIVLVSSLVALVASSPKFKKSYVDILEALDIASQAKRGAPPATTQAGGSGPPNPPAAARAGAQGGHPPGRGSEDRT